MTDTYTSYDLVEFDKPLQARTRPMPVPLGTEVLVRVRRSGVCHSDLHIQEGFFDQKILPECADPNDTRRSDARAPVPRYPAALA